MKKDILLAVYLPLVQAQILIMDSYVDLVFSLVGLQLNAAGFTLTHQDFNKQQDYLLQSLYIGADECGTFSDAGPVLKRRLYDLLDLNLTIPRQCFKL